MSFIDSLRMNGLMRSNNSSPIGMPDMSGPNSDFMSDLLNRALSSLGNFREHNSGVVQTPAPKGELGNIGNRLRNEQPQQEKPMNVVYKPDMSEYQKAQLSLARNKESDTNAVSRERLGVQERNSQRSSQDRNRGFDIEEFKAMHPNKVFKESKGGNIFAFDPISGESVDTGVSTGTMSDADRLALTGKQAMERVDKQGKNAKELESNKNTNVLAQIAERARQQQDTNKSNAVSKYIFQNPADKPKTAKRTGSITSDDGKGNRSTKYTYSDDKTDNPDEGSSEPDTVVVEKDGKQFHLPANQIDEAMKQGYKKVK